MSAALRALRAVHASISFGARGPSRSASEPGGSLVARPRRPPVQFVLEKEIPMLTALSGYIRDRWPFSHTVRIAGLENFVERCHAEAWHIYAIKKRIWRRHVCVACGWPTACPATRASSNQDAAAARICSGWRNRASPACREPIFPPKSSHFAVVFHARPERVLMSGRMTALRRRVRPGAWTPFFRSTGCITFPELPWKVFCVPTGPA